RALPPPPPPGGGAPPPPGGPRAPRLTVPAPPPARAAVAPPVLGFIVWLGGQLVYSTNSRLLEIDPGSFVPGEEREVAMHFTAALGVGRYTITLAAANEHEGVVYDWVNHATGFLVVGATSDGLVDLGADFTIGGSRTQSRGEGEA